MEDLLDRILEGYPLSPDGDHGAGHWLRVLENGLYLARHTGADEKVVRLFALFHDSRRFNEDEDPGHGRRGAALATELRGSCFDLPDDEFSVLVEACSCHTDNCYTGDRRTDEITLQACWDADRLDIGRVGITPDPAYLYSAIAKRDHIHPRFDHARDMARARALLSDS